MKVTLIQSALFWEDSPKNISHFDSLLSSIKETTDLIILPEMFTTGFAMNPEAFVEPANGTTLQWLREKAKEKNAVITGSVAVEEKGNYYNRLFWVQPNGEYQYYNKRHLFRMAKEDQFYTAGNKKIIGKINDWNICPLVCYDLRFPVWSRNTFKKVSETNCEAEYDVLIYVANWPEVRSYPWKQLLIARAIENQCYVIGLNRIGKDGNGFDHSGDSVVINPRGEIISNIKANEEIIQTIELDKNYLEEFRKIFPVGLDADDFELK
ncbi:MAG: amidohydrolase [Bacteroidetes bacterium]|nr:amidohydrolase [Bacteroidota bacterium]